jgi:hypothetical protein
MAGIAGVPKRKHYSTANQVCERYGGRSLMWLWRLLKSDPRFPRPFTTGSSGKLRLFDDDELDAYDEIVRAASKAGAPNG